MEKICTLCDQTKLIEQFGKHKQMKGGHLNQCKSCRSAYMKSYEMKNKEKRIEKSKEYYEIHKEQIKERVRNHWKDNANEINQMRRSKYENDEEYRKKVLNECSKSNAKCRPNRNKNAKDNKTPSYYLELCRKRMWHAFHGREAKSDKTKALLGCDGEFLKQYLEGTKVVGKDYSNAHIDHIIPCSSFDFSDEEQQKKCFHYTNLQLLPANENLKKSNRVF